jgi:hypothetical protein
VFFFGPLHVLFVYGVKRISDMFEKEEAVRLELDRRASMVPPDRQLAELKRLRKKENLARIEREVFLMEQVKIDDEKRRKFWFAVCYWSLAGFLWLTFGFVNAVYAMIILTCLYGLGIAIYMLGSSLRWKA